jgi:hypothetical protein
VEQQRAPPRVALERAAQVGLDLEPAAGFGVHRRAKTATRARPALLARYIARSALRSSSSTRSPGPPSARPMLAPMTTSVVPCTRNGIWRRRRCVPPPAGRHLVRDVVDEDAELVPAEARERVRGAQAARDASHRLPEERVARGVAEAVVHALEVVQVEHEHHRAPTTRRLGERVGDPVLEEQAIRQPGQCVVERLVRERGLQSLALGHVPARGSGTPALPRT